MEYGTPVLRDVGDSGSSNATVATTTDAAVLATITPDATPVATASIVVSSGHALAIAVWPCVVVRNAGVQRSVSDSSSSST